MTTFGVLNLLAVLHGTGQALTLIGWLIVLGCLIAAAYCAYLRNVIGAALLLVVAIIAAALLL